MNRKQKRKARSDGRAVAGKWRFQGEDGAVKPESNAIFPLITQTEEEYRIIGTGFYISANGLFMTARHVIMDVCDNEARATGPLAIMHMYPENKYLFRPVVSSWSSNEADLSIGVAAPMHSNIDGSPLVNECLTLTRNIPPKGADVATYAYPNSEYMKKGNTHIIRLAPNFYDGVITDHHERVLGGPAYQTTIHMHGGSSGGPVIDNTNGCVFAVNSNSFHDQTDISFAAPIAPAFLAKIDKVALEGHEAPTKFEDLISAGHISVR